MYIYQHNNNFLNHKFIKPNDRIFDLKGTEICISSSYTLNETVIQIIHCLNKKRTR